jgi:fumarylacetoacetase
MPYLRESKPGLYDIDLSVLLQPEGGGAEEIARTNYREMYYSAAQQLTHHASSGCAMNAGDLLGSGTISGPEKSQRGSLLELSWGGKEPITLTDGSTQKTSSRPPTPWSSSIRVHLSSAARERPGADARPWPRSGALL